MEYKVYNHEENYLSHHGILGQRWGIRRYQNRDGSLTTLGKKLRSSIRKEEPLQIGNIYNHGGSGGYITFNEYKKFSNSTKNVRENIIRTMEKQAKNDQQNQRGLAWSINLYKKKNEELEYNKNVKGPDDIPKKKVSTSALEDLESVNPNTMKPGYTQNCVYCSVVYDLRIRGFDITARSRKNGGCGYELGEFYKDADKRLKTYDGSGSTKALVDEISKMPVGSRGMISGITDKHGGHNFNFQKVDKDLVAIIDSQIGKAFAMEDYFRKSPYVYYELLRTDDLEPNWNRIGETINPDDLKKR